MRMPIQSQRRQRQSVIGTMPVRGVNNKDNPQLVDLTSADLILNYYLDGVAQLTKRKGTALSVDTDTPLKSVWQQWDDVYDVVAYDEYIKLYNRNTGAFTTLASDLTDTEVHEGARAGAYFFITNKTDGPKRIKYQIEVNFDTNYSGNNVVWISGDYTASSGSTWISSSTFTGVTSGASCEIVAKRTDADDSHTAIIFTVTSGTLLDGEPLLLEINHVATQRNPSTQINQFSYYGNSSPVVYSVPCKAIGQKVTGKTSRFTAEIVYEKNFAHTRGDTSRNLYTLKNVIGEPIVGETILGDKDTMSVFSGAEEIFGRATIVTAGYTVDSLYQDGSSLVPKAGGVSVNGSRVFLFNLPDDDSATRYSAVPTEDEDTGWVTKEVGYSFYDSSNVTGGGLVYYSEAGTARSNAQIGNIYMTFCDRGWYAWSIDQITLGSTVGKANTIIGSQLGSGGARGAIMTPIGLCVANRAGVTAWFGIGSTTIPYSKQSRLLTDSLGNEFFEDVSFDNCSMAYDTRRQILYVACAKDSDLNNLVLVIRAESGVEAKSGAQGAVTFFDWPVHRFLVRDDGTLYATTRDGDLWLLDTGTDDGGLPIYTELVQETNFGLTDLFNTDEWLWKGQLSPNSSINVSFDYFDKDMYLTENTENYTWVPKTSYSAPTGFSSGGFGASGFSSSLIDSGLLEEINGARPGIRNASRVKIRFSSNDYAPHSINWIKASVTPVRANRQRTLKNS